MNQYLYVTDTMHKRVIKYRMSATGKLAKKEEIPLQHAPYSIEVDGREFILGVVPRLIDIVYDFNSLDYSNVRGGWSEGGASALWWDGNDWIKQELAITEQVAGASSVARVGEQIVIGSRIDSAVAVCQNLN